MASQVPARRPCRRAARLLRHHHPPPAAQRQSSLGRSQQSRLIDALGQLPTEHLSLYFELECNVLASIVVFLYSIKWTSREPPSHCSPMAPLEARLAGSGVLGRCGASAAAARPSLLSCTKEHSEG